MQNNYIRVLNPLRAIAALGVCLVHFGGLGLFGNSTISTIFSCGQLGVYVFFVISGFIIPYSLYHSEYKTSNFFNYILRRSVRIDPPYFVAILLTLLLSYLVTIRPGYVGEGFHFNILQLIAHITYTVPLTNYGWYSHVFWTLCIEFQFYIFMGLMMRIITRSSFIVILSILGFVSLSSLFHFNKAYYCISTYSSVFCIGIVTYCLKIAKLSSSQFFLALFVFFGIEYLQSNGLIVPIVSVITALVITYSNYSNSVLNFIGKISYSLYITHGLIVTIFGFIVKRYVMSVGMKFIFLSVELLVACAFAYLFYWVVEERFIRIAKTIKLDNSKKEINITS